MTRVLHGYILNLYQTKSLTIRGLQNKTVYKTMIYKEVTRNDFIDEFDTFNRSKNFTVAGRVALYDYLFELSGDYYEKGLELDVIALCCEYTEYATANECASNYFEYEGMLFDEDGVELLTVDEVEQKALDFLEYKTTVIKFDGGIIIQNF